MLAVTNRNTTMKIAFLGKGGSGKSTLATAAVMYLKKHGYRVLAIDADHNMDLSFNLGADPQVFLGTDPYLIKRSVGLTDAASFMEARAHGIEQRLEFRLTPPDTFTKSVTIPLDMDSLLMVVGPHTDIVRSGEHCSHSLAAPLKVYLPLLQLKENEAVVIDERAGTDPVATGILYGVDVAVIVVEPTPHSIRVAQQIADELRRAGVRYAFVGNKMTDDAVLPFETIATIKKSADVLPEIEAVFKNL